MQPRIKTWSYSGDPSSSPKDAVRFHVGDTDPNDKLLDDCEIEYLLTEEGTVLGAAICAALGLAAMFARDFDGSFGKTKSAKPHEHYLELAKALKEKRGRRPVVAYAGGISKADKQGREADTDRVRPAFRRDLHDNPFTEVLDGFYRCL